jgi:hypothetical protein
VAPRAAERDEEVADSWNTSSDGSDERA